MLQTRMQPIGIACKKLPRLVRDLATELRKPIELEMHGAETELDRQVLELIKDPLTHMVRNAADHGVEAPAERAAGGKPERGTIRLSASQRGGYIIIDVSDDGRGLDMDRIAGRALHLGLATQAHMARMSEADLQQFIFAPGFSTVANATTISGRGIGMDVVRANIDQIGGSIEVNSFAVTAPPSPSRSRSRWPLYPRSSLRSQASVSLCRSFQSGSSCACASIGSRASNSSATLQ